MWILVAVLTLWALLSGLKRWQEAKAAHTVGRPAAPLGPLGDPEGRVVWFFAPHCRPCHAMRPDIDALGDGVIAVDVTQHPDLARAYGVMATPTTVWVREGRIQSVKVGVVALVA